ncbi:MAG: hypothetical protein RL748_946 [Pseudomonadota bacterium]
MPKTATTMSPNKRTSSPLPAVAGDARGTGDQTQYHPIRVPLLKETIDQHYKERTVVAFRTAQVSDQQTVNDWHKKRAAIEPSTDEYLGYLTKVENFFESATDECRGCGRAYTVVLLSFNDKNNKWLEQELFGFCSVIIYPKSDKVEAELGRLLMSPLGILNVKKRAGILASAILRTLAEHTMNNLNASRVYIRVVPSNIKGSSVARWTGFSKVDASPSWAERAPKADWYLAVHSVSDKSAGKFLQDKRNKKGKSTSHMENAGITRSALNQYESGRSKPSWSALENIALALELSEKELCQIMMAFAGRKLSDGVVFPEDLQVEVENAALEDLWIFSERFDEAQNSQTMRSTVTALVSGKKRYFFLPESEIKKASGTHMIKDIWTKIDEIDDLSIADREDAKIRVRLYVAPQALCVLGVAMFSPIEVHYGETRGVRQVSIRGNANGRIILPETVQQELYKSVLDSIQLTLREDKLLDEEIAGFKRIL